MLLGLCGGFVFAKQAQSDKLMIWFAFTVLTLLHLLANYLGVRGVQPPQWSWLHSRLTALHSVCSYLC